MAIFFNQNLKYLRSQRKLSQQQLADALGIDRSSISRWENGEMGATVEKAIEIAKILNVSLPDFLGKDLKNEDINNTRQFTEEEKKEALKQVLKDKGFLNDNEEMSPEDFNRLIDFAKRNKDFIVDKK